MCYILPFIASPPDTVGVWRPAPLVPESNLGQYWRSQAHDPYRLTQAPWHVLPNAGPRSLSSESDSWPYRLTLGPMPVLSEPAPRSTVRESGPWPWPLGSQSGVCRRGGAAGVQRRVTAMSRCRRWRRCSHGPSPAALDRGVNPSSVLSRGAPPFWSVGGASDQGADDVHPAM